MWTKNFRRALISAVYQDIFTTALDEVGVSIIDLKGICNEYSSTETPLVQSELEGVFDVYRSKTASYTERIKSKLTSWDKTYPLIKATLISFALEIDLAAENTVELEPNIVNKYVRLAQEFAGGDNPGLVHAVASKIFDENKDN